MKEGIWTALAFVVAIFILLFQAREGLRCEKLGGTYLSREWKCLDVKTIKADNPELLKERAE